MKNTFSFPFLSIILVMISSCKDPETKKSNFQNYLKNTNWLVDRGGLMTPDGEKIYYLSKKIDTAIIFNFYGVNFLDEEKFNSYDAWQCGNDCFTEIHGRYYFTEANQIKIEVDSITKSEFCNAPTQTFKPPKFMSFNVSKEGEQIKLIRK